jgi:NADPH-dependent glutamate synthase beta subunit-like oxidoreductase/Pyruvate/2-oxoacid:ferredoxin oxidoreductase delta subunit
MMLAGQGRFREAWETMIVENPFPAVCGRVCFHTCESGCNRGEFDQPLAIHQVERAIAEYAVKRRFELPPPVAESQKIDVAFIGAGPAGLSAAYFLNRLGYRCHVYEARQEAGGLLRWGIPAYRLPPDILRAEIGRIEGAGVCIHLARHLHQDFFKRVGDTHQAVFVGCGLGRRIALNIPGQTLLSDGLRYLDRIRGGEKKRIRGRVAVIGGGNTAVDVARTLVRQGAEPVILYRRRRADMPAFKQEVEQAQDEGVTIRELLSPVSVEKFDNGLTLNMQKMRVLGDAGQGGRARVVASEAGLESVSVTQAFVAIGAEAEPQWSPVGGLRLSHCTLVDRDVPVVYGGDLASPVMSVSHAILSGKQAALALDVFFKNGLEAVEKRLAACRISGGSALSMTAYTQGSAAAGLTGRPVSIRDIKVDCFDHAGRHDPPAVPLGERKGSFCAAEKSLSPNAVMDEAGRCFSCGYCNSCGFCELFCPEMAVNLEGEPAIDMDYCKGCGVCVEECPGSAMRLVVEGV